MMRRVLVIIGILSFLATAASALTVTGSRSTAPSGGLDASGFVGSDALTLNWICNQSGSGTLADPYQYVYTYSFTGSTVTPDVWYLELSPGVTELADFKTAGGTVWTAALANHPIITGAVTVDGESFQNAIEFTSAYASGGQYIFKTGHGFVPGDALFVDGSKYAYNAGIGTDYNPFVSTDLTPWVLAVDTHSDVNNPYTIVPEPSLTILALLGLVGGALGRRASRKKKED